MRIARRITDILRWMGSRHRRPSDNLHDDRRSIRRFWMNRATKD